MNVGHIKIKYHPVKKEMYFFRFENGGWAQIIGPNSILKKYYIEKQGNILLQNLGNDFFSEIIHAMDGVSKIQIDFEGTKLDWGDFKNMLDYYNAKISEVFLLGDFIELPDVQKIYDDVRSYSSEVVDIFKEHICKTQNETLIYTIKKLEDELRKKTLALDRNDVNLCFVGTYSSGKSTLINAIIGRAILPEAIKSETAKMFKVVNCPTDIMKISFLIEKGIENYQTTLEWDNEKNAFYFSSGPKEDSIRVGIQHILNATAHTFRHEQAREILSFINKQKDSNKICNGNESRIDGIIEIHHNIPMSKKINFTIFDTPGTDSDNIEHLDILKSAMHEQTNSILVFVNWPNKEEGTGNRMLVDLLNDVNKTTNNSTIDLGRSLFVINGCDYLTDNQQFDDLKKSTLVVQKNKEKSDEDFEMSLQDKRLFFTSASAAYAARATLNRVDTEKEKKLIKKFRYSLVEDEDAGYYKYNHLALSQHETDAMLQDAQEKAKGFEENGDTLNLFNVNSGLYSLENEIIKYGEKYALSVKAKGIIDAVNRVIVELKGRSIALRNALVKTRNKLDEEITILRTTLKADIGRCFTLDGTADNIENDTLVTLQIDENALCKYLKDAEAICDEMPSFKIFKRDKLNDINKDICDALTRKMSDHKGIYTSNRDMTLKTKRDDLIVLIQDKINKFKGLDEETKTYILAIGEIAVDPPKEISSLFNFNMIREKHWYADTVNKDTYKENIIKVFSTELDTRKEKCKADYIEEWKNIRERIKSSFLHKIDEFSGQLQEMKENRAKVQIEVDQLSEIVDELGSKEQILNETIWGEKH